MAKTTVLLADCEPIFIEGLKVVLQAKMDIVGAVRDGRALLRQVKTLKPQLVIADVALPGLNAIAVLRQLTERKSSTKMMFLTMVDDASTIAEALRAGAVGYVLKTSMASELQQAITQVLKGGTYITPRVSRTIRDNSPDFEKHRHPLGFLTKREREVLQLVAAGRSSKEIASILHVSIKTVEFHRMNICNRLDIHSIAELTRYAIHHGISPA